MSEPVHLRLTYNEVHKIIGNAAEKIADWRPDLLIAIGGGGFFPARVLRTFLKDPKTKRNLPIYAIGLSLYESLPGTTAEQVGNQVIRTQWLGLDGAKPLLGRRVLIVDEVDDTRKTLHYATKELKEDIEKELSELPENEREAARTQFAIFVVHNKLKEKRASVSPDIPYFAGDEVPDYWLDYPWEMRDIDEHDRLAAQDRARKEVAARTDWMSFLWKMLYTFWAR